MHKMVGLVFKILMMSLLLMFLLDTTLLLVNIISIHSKVSSITGLMQTEVARNNCMPEDAANMFREYLDSLVGPKILKNPDYIRTNMTSGIVVDGKSYEDLTPDNCKDYGELVDVVVQVELHPIYAYIASSTDNGNFLYASDDNGLTLNYIYKVPCLRYLK